MLAKKEEKKKLKTFLEKGDPNDKTILYESKMGVKKEREDSSSG